MQNSFTELIHATQWIIPPKTNFPIRNLNTFKIGGNVDLLLTLSNQKEVEVALEKISQFKIPFLILGRGSNSIFPDEGMRGVILQLGGEWKQLQLLEKNRIQVGCGLANTSLAAQCRKNGWGDLEFLATIPGSIGGGVFMNAGAHGKEFQDIVESVQVFYFQQKKFLELKKEDLDFQYRSSKLKTKTALALSAILRFTPKPSEVVQIKQRKLLEKREKTQPIKSRNWGSVFKNPTGYSAGKLIEDCGLKGKGFGDAVISSIHANFIENVGKAKFQDTLQTIILAKQKVKEKFGIELIPEVQVFSKKGEVLSLE